MGGDIGGDLGRYGGEADESRPAASPRTVSVISTESPSCPLASSCASAGSRSTWWVRVRVRVRVRVGVRIRARSSPSA